METTDYSARLNLHRFRNSADRGRLAAPLHLHRQEQRLISTPRFFVIFKDFVFGPAEVFPNKYDERRHWFETVLLKYFQNGNNQMPQKAVRNDIGPTL